MNATMTTPPIAPQVQPGSSPLSVSSPSVVFVSVVPPSFSLKKGASAPESIVQNVVQAISLELNAVAEELGKNKENIYFRLPPELR